MHVKMIVLTTATLLMAGCASSTSMSGGKAARADLVDAAGKPSGSATIRESADGLWLDVSVKGVAPGAHGLHVHAVGKARMPAMHPI